MLHNPDYKDLLSLLNAKNAEYLIIGAQAVIYYTEPRYTKDFDIWINPTVENAERVFDALKEFGAPLKNLTPEAFTDKDGYYQIGIAPNRIDIIMDIESVQFHEAWENRVSTTYDTVPINIISKDHLIQAKLAASRPMDLIDVDKLKIWPDQN